MRNTVDWYCLKKRALAAVGGRDESDVAFLELPTGLAPVPECVIQFEDSGGILRVHLKGYSATDIAVVGRGLRGLN